MKGRTPTAHEKKYMSAVIQKIPCWCCQQLGVENRIEDVLPHHVFGKTKQFAHYLVIPLCNYHHAYNSHHGLHANTFEWEKKWGRQEDILEEIHAMMQWELPGGAKERIAIYGVHL